MLLACKVAVRDNERTRTAYLSMFVVCLCIRLCIRLIYVKINSYVCLNLYKYTLIKKEKYLASPYVYVNLMQQGCQIKYLASRSLIKSSTYLPSFLPRKICKFNVSILASLVSVADKLKSRSIHNLFSVIIFTTQRTVRLQI